MRIRTQLRWMIGAVATVLAATVLAVLAADRLERAAARAQARAEEVAHQVTGLSTLAQEYARYGEPRAAEQWHRRQRTIAAALEVLQAGPTQMQPQAQRDELEPRAGAAPLAELRAATQALPPLFTRLQELGSASDAFTERRRAALADQLLTTTQAMSDFAYQWASDVAEARAAAGRQARFTAAVALGVLLLALFGMVWLMHRRVLRPLDDLARAVAAVREGDLAVRLASERADEFGDTARQFDAMTAALAASRAELQRSERQLRAITDNLPVLVAHIDRDERYTFANAQFRHMLGLDPAAMIGRTVRELRPDFYDAVLAPHLKEALRGRTCAFEGSRRTDAGEQHYRVTYVPDLDAEGGPQGCFSLTIDRTEEREAERERARSEARLLDLMNHIPAMVAYFDMQERCLYANDSGLKAQGLQRSQLPGLTLRAVLGESNYAQHEPYVREALAGRRALFGGRIAFVERAAHFQAHLIPDRVDGGEQRGFYLMTFDVTALQEARLRHERAQSQLRAISDHLPVLVAHIDEGERFTFMNRTYQDWLGVDPERSLGRPVAEVIGEDLYRQRADAVRRALGGERVEIDIDSEMGGTRRALRNVYVPDRRSDGSVAGCFALSMDVSAMKAVERDLARLARADSLTDLPNRRQLEEQLPLALARARRAGRDLALMFLDIDHFKRINDTLGHTGGDAVLREFALRLKRSVRMTDTVARLAGDEFVIVLEGLHGDGEAQAVARKVLDEVRRPFWIDGRESRVTTSIGIVVQPPGPQTPTSATDLLARADRALYAAKAAGRDGFSFAERLAGGASPIAA